MAISARENGQTADIIATDIDQRSLDKAMLGRYPKQELNETPESIKRKYFTEDRDFWVVDPALRRFDSVQESTTCLRSRWSADNSI